MRHFKPFGFKCKICRNFSKELHNCDLTYGEKKVSIMLCHRCLRRMGLEEKKKEDELA